MPPDDRRDPLISGPPKFRWPWDRAKDVDIGDRNRVSSDSIDRPAGFSIPGFKAPAGVGFGRRGGTGAPAGWKIILVRLAVIGAVAYHAAPALAWATGPVGGRQLLDIFGRLIPDVAGVDVGYWYATGGAAWFWQPGLVIVGALLLRLAAFNSASRDPVGAIWIAATALVLDLITWLAIGLKLWGTAYSPAEGAALITLLKVEGAALLGLFFILAPTGKRKLGETDAHVDRG